MGKNIQLKDKDGPLYPITGDWKKLSTGVVDMPTLGSTYTSNLVDRWDNYREILVYVGENEYRETTPIILYPSLPTQGAVFNLHALSSYQIFAYICLGATIGNNGDKYKICCMPREMKGYTISRILAVYGKK